MQALDLLWLIPALPLAGAALNGALALRRSPDHRTDGGHGGGTGTPTALHPATAPGAPLGSLLVTVACLWQYLGGGLYPRAVEQVCYPWTAGALRVDVAFLLDPLAAVMLFIVTFVGFLIHVYSVGYMAHEEGYGRYFSYLNLFMAAVLTPVLGHNILVMVVRWDGVG